MAAGGPSPSKEGDIEYLLLDSGSDEHVCTLGFGGGAPARPGDDDTAGGLFDVQGNQMHVVASRDVQLTVQKRTSGRGWPQRRSR